MAEKKSSRFKLGLFLGGLVGGITALLFSPHTGKENRKLATKKLEELEKFLRDKDVDKKVKKIFGKVNKTTKDFYSRAKTELAKGLSETKGKISDLDKKKYQKIVEKVMKNVKKRWKKDAKKMVSLKKDFLSRWKME